MVLHLLAAGFAALMLLRYGRAAATFLAPRTAPAERWRALPGFLAAAVAVLLLAASLRLWLQTRR